MVVNAVEPGVRSLVLLASGKAVVVIGVRAALVSSADGRAASCGGRML